ncbi:alkyl hydroperoxide reductase [Elizabethkingia anophelis]|nr:alkyl hydroperoxide reductase [Elizabethkingia anophelis]
MFFPHFAGRTYDFIIFQGLETKTVAQGTIPADGKFILNIPEEYRTYTGMSRWLITNSREGGGLDMYIPGHDFSVSCESVIPNDKNIIYTKNVGNRKLNDLYSTQEVIIQRYETMQQALKVFTVSNKNYAVFRQESEKQQNAYKVFHSKLLNNPDYIEQLIPIINITRGIGTQLYEESNKKEYLPLNITRYIRDTMDWKVLYTSGHWNTVIDIWVVIHIKEIKDIQNFARDYQKIHKRMIGSEKMDVEFTQRVLYNLQQNKATEYINAIHEKKN